MSKRTISEEELRHIVQPSEDNSVGSKIFSMETVFNDSSDYRVKAFYRDPMMELPEYRECPLILALPPYRNRLEMAAALRGLYELPHDESCRTWPVEMRLLALSRIPRNVITLPVQMKLLDWMHQQIRAHYYVTSAECSPRNLQEKYLAQQAGVYQILEPPKPAHSSSLLLLGLSGVGKSTNTRLALSQFPRVIVHEEFNGKRFLCVQIVWIYVTCPHNSSISSLCRFILAWVDYHLGTTYRTDMEPGRWNSADYVEKVGLVLLHHKVGLLVIDEIQNALRKQEEREMLDLLVNMLNMNACPMLALGTPETALIAPKKLRLVRRIGGHEVGIDPFEEGKDVPCARDRDWYLKSLTRLDFLPVPFSDSQGVYDALMTCSAGIPAFLTLAWMLTQYLGLTSGKEQVTPSLVFAATKDTFRMVKGLLTAIRKKDLRKLALIGDVAIKEVREHLGKWLTEESSAEYHQACENQQETVAFYKALSTLLNLGIGQGDAELGIATAQRESPKADAKELVRRVLERHRAPPFENKSPSPDSDGKRAPDEVSEQAASHAQTSPKEQAAKKDESDPGFGTFRNRRKSPNAADGKAHAGPKVEQRTADETFGEQLHPASTDAI
jgi:hypothetical protein